MGKQQIVANAKPMPRSSAAYDVTDATVFMNTAAQRVSYGTATTIELINDMPESAGRATRPDVKGK